MIIEERKIKVSEVTEGYFNDNEEGVTGYNDRDISASKNLLKLAI